MPSEHSQSADADETYATVPARADVHLGSDEELAEVRLTEYTPLGGTGNALAGLASPGGELPVHAIGNSRTAAMSARRVCARVCMRAV